MKLPKLNLTAFLSAIAILAISLTSCSTPKSYYTKDIHDSNRWSESELRNIQFYLSGDILLWRNITRGESTVVDGTIKIKEGKEVEEIIIRKGTKGVYLFSPQHNNYAVSFESDDNKYLVFGPSAKADNRYVLLAKEWVRNSGKVTYGDKTYNTTNQSAFAFLLADIDVRGRTSVSKTTAGGRSVK